MSRVIRRLLVANRGEIAVRVIRAAREMGIATVAVFSTADRHAMHAALADESLEIGSGAAASSYLDSQKIINAAVATGADAIHPGYGFLSERADFSQACVDAGLTFIGPPAEAMRRLGSKIEAKALAVQYGVPIVPGSFEPGSSFETLKLASDRLGYPVLLKASAGGGGRGMRVVTTANDFESEFRMATDEALKAFGDGSMMVEKFIERPRHIEVQVLADNSGQVACLFERECSIQRRHQKLLEESPSPLAEYGQMWPAMREASISLIQASGYVGAGTVEFIVDPATGRFYFLEVNARLQVEHPVTEAVSGVDLVQWQLRIAQGERLDINAQLMDGDRSRQIGHAVEARILAEDPERNFLPSVGAILAWHQPVGPGIRVDTGYGQGMEVPPYYDSLLAKVIVHADSRATALRKLCVALEDFHVLGVKTNIAFLLKVLRSEEFQTGDIDTNLVDRAFGDLAEATIPSEIATIALETRLSRPRQGPNLPSHSVWGQHDGFFNTK